MRCKSRDVLPCVTLLLLAFFPGCRAPEGTDASGSILPGVPPEPAKVEESAPTPAPAPVPAVAAPTVAAPEAAIPAPESASENPAGRSERLSSVLAETRLVKATQETAHVKEPAHASSAPPDRAQEILKELRGGGQRPLDSESAHDLAAQALLKDTAVATSGEKVTRGGGQESQPAVPPPAPTAVPTPSPPPAAPPAQAPVPGTPPAVVPAPATAPPAAATPPAASAREMPKGIVTIKEMYHKTADELLRFVKEQFPEWIAKGNLAKVESKARSVVIFGETADEKDPLTKRISSVVDSFDDLELRLESRVVRPHYVDVQIAMDTLVMRGLANIWQLTEETNTATRLQPDGKTTIVGTHKHTAFAQTGIVSGQGVPIPAPPKVPYVYEVPTSDPFEMPKTNTTTGAAEMVIVSFNKMSSTEERGSFVAVGTTEDIERIQAFVDSIDIPARQIMIEVQVIELEANKLLDFGFDSFQFGKRHTLGTGAFPLPGDPVVQPGLPDALRRPGVQVPDVAQEGLGLIFDDSSIDVSGRFLTTLHALVREGDATVKARPKILTLDDRVSVLHLGQEVPVFRSTGVTRDATNGNLVSEVNQVSTQYVGFTLNMRPRVSGGAEDEVSLQVEVIVNELGERQRVFEQDLLGIPTVIKRQYIGQNRVKNHRPIILGGLIQEKDVESVNKIPLLADIPLLGYLFRRTQKTQSRAEIILVLTPHILGEKGVDRIATPKESSHFDTFDSVLFNDRHIIKGRDVIGIDPISGNPAQSAEGKVFSEEEVIDLTILNIVRERELVSKLNIFENYLADAAKDLSWLQRKYPESTVKSWSSKDQEIFFRAAAIVIENVKELNPDLTYDEVRIPRREILLPTTPYRISLSYDKVKTLQALGNANVLRGQRVELTEQTIALVRDAAGRSLRDFGDFLETRKRKAEDHGELLSELKRLQSGQAARQDSLEGLAYPQVFRQLASAKYDFVSVATYFQENLSDRYPAVGAPDVGMFEVDLKAFLQASVSLHQRAKRLMELDDKWSRLNTPDTEAQAGEVETP